MGLRAGLRSEVPKRALPMRARCIVVRYAREGITGATLAVGRRAVERARARMLRLAVVRGATYRARDRRLAAAAPTAEVGRVVLVVVVVHVAVDRRLEVLSSRGYLRPTPPVLVVGHRDVALHPRGKLPEGEGLVGERGDVRAELLAQSLVDLRVEHRGEEVLVERRVIEDAITRVRRLEARDATMVILDEVERGHGLRLLELDEVDEM